MGELKNIRQDKQNIVKEIIDLTLSNDVRNLIVIIETTNGEIKTCFDTKSVHEEIGLLELAKIDALKYRNIL